jgi:uncharacterized protein YbjT (DUF2867 family)
MSGDFLQEAYAPVLVLGGTGFVGKRLVRDLLKRKVSVRILSRSTEKAFSMFGDKVQVVKGDLFTGEGLGDALDGVEAAYYLVHSMGGRTLSKNTEYAARDKQCVINFNEAAFELKRVIYLGGLGEVTSELSEHLRSRAKIAKMLRNGPAEATILRAAVIIGAGGASFEILRYLVERLPVMICPRWINTRIQPIAVKDVIDYLSGCLFDERTRGKVYDIGGEEILTYRVMMDMYAEARGIAKRIIFTIPFLTPELSSYWIDLVTPVPSGIAHPLIEGLRNEVICRNNDIREVLPIKLTSFKEAVKIAISEEFEGPGITGF